MIFNYTLLEKLLLRFNVIPHPVYDALVNVIAGRALQASLKLGLVDLLSEGYHGLSEIQQRLSFSTEGIELLMTNLVALGYVKKTKKDMYSLSKRGQRFFNIESKYAIRNFVYFSEQVYKEFLDLEQSIKSGEAVRSLETLNPQQWEIFTNAMIEMARTNAKSIARAIPLLPSQKRLLDLGGMHGLYAIEFCKYFPQLTAVIVDYEDVRKYAERLIAQNNLQERIIFRVGDFVKESFGSGYDIILAFNIIHGLKADVNNDLTKKVFSALNPAGFYVILDQIKDSFTMSNLSRLFVSSIGLMLLNKVGGKTYPLEEIKKWCRDAAFSKLEFKRMMPPGYGMIIATK
ncbi:MAG: hypothetical protein HYV42_03230 [Candidatus Magasanikbacteria bacterium]|nr:hypothetical protein [Candidatus Magasanikbacteria bacterium]